MSRAHIAELDLTGVNAVCISYIEGLNTLSALRYLVRRLRQRARATKLVVGLWAADAATISEDRIQSAVGADIHVNTLKGAVDACIEAARAHPQLAA